MVLYDTMEISPLNKPRKVTNRISLGVFAVFMVAYFGIAIYAFVKGDIKNINGNTYNNSLSNFIKQILDKINDQKWTIIGYLAFSIVSTLLCLGIVRGVSRFIIKVSVVMECLYLLLCVIKLISAIIYFDILLVVYQLISTFFTAWGVYVKLYAVKTIGTRLMSSVVKEACKVVFFFPSLIGLNIILTVLIFSVIIFGTSVLVHLCTISTSSFLTVLFHFVNIYSTIWLCLALGIIGQMISCGTFGTWYWSMEKSTVPNNTSLQNVAITFMYHSGTIAYMSSLWAAFPIMWIMIKGLMNRKHESRHDIFILIVCWFNVFTSIFDSSIAVTAIHGTSIKKSADTVCQLYLRSPVHLYAISKACDWCTTVMIIINMIMISIITLVIQKPNSNEVTVVASIIIICTIFVALPLIIIFISAIKSIFYCILEDYERSTQDASRRCFMNRQIKDLMDAVTI